MDVVLLSRLQFAFTIMFHYLFPPLTIGLGLVMVYLEGMYIWKREPIYETAARFWTMIFAVTFAVGVASGIVMEFQFGTNWAVYSRYVGDVFGSALAAEGIFAFFLESGFLAVLVFGWDRVSAGFHFFATVMVFVGAIFSSVWITVANSWQQTPAGYHLVDHVINGHVFTRAEITDFWAMVFNPSSVHRLVHVWIGAFILGAFFVMSISAWYMLKDRHVEFARRSFTGALVLALVMSVAQWISGHLQAENVAEHQPAKLAAFEGHFTRQPGRGAPLYLFGWPDAEARTVRGGVAIPGGLSFVLHGDWTAPVPALDELEPTWGSPPIWLTFQSYHIMVAIGVVMVVTTLLALGYRVRGTLWCQRWLLWYFVGAVVLGYIANQLGWVAAEVGRQPWVVYPTLLADGTLYGGLRTADAVSEVVSAGEVLASIIMFGLIYSLLFAVWIYVLNHKIQKGPMPVAAPARTTMRGLMDAASDKTDRAMTERRSDTP
jgi:cytochrome bd ubiquinol oxidase subunit I